MDIEDQKMMALDGLHAWLRATIAQVSRISETRQRTRQIIYESTRNLLHVSSAVREQQTELKILAGRDFMAERHLFLISAHKVTEYIKWCNKLDFIDAGLFDEFLAFENNIRTMRDANEHVIKHFTGRGQRHNSSWVYSDENGTVDASSTIDRKIGGRLDWNEVAAAASRLIPALLPGYYPDRHKAPTAKLNPEA